MKPIKTLHFADLHLGSDFRSLGSIIAQERRSDVKRTFNRIMELAKDEKVELLLISGDLFDSWDIGEDNYNLVKNSFAQLKNTWIVISAGNHDPLIPNSLYARENFWSSNVIIMPHEFSSVLIDELKVEVFGASFSDYYCFESLWKKATPKKPHYKQIGVLHGTLGTASEYNPIDTKDIAVSGLSYLALGHIHKPSGVVKAGNTSYAYPGCPEGRGFDELGQRGVLLGEIGENYAKMEFVSVSQRMYIELTCDLSQMADYQDAARIINQAITDKYGESGDNNLYRIYLTGKLDTDVYLDLESLKDALNQLYYLVLRDRTSYNINLGSLSDEVSLRGIFVRRMLEKIDDKDSPEVQKALALGLKAFSEEVGYIET